MAILEFITGFFELTGNPVWDWIIAAFLVPVCAVVAYWIGSQLGYHDTLGKVLWVLTAVSLYAVIAGLIRFALWLFSIPWWVWVIIGVVFIAVVITVIVITTRNRKRCADDSEEPVDDG